MEPLSPNQTSIILAQANRRDSSVSTVRRPTISGADMDFAHAAGGGTTWQTCDRESKAFGAETNDGRLALEEAVKRIVSVFDACCRDWAAQLATLPMRPRRRRELLDTLFHRLDAVEVMKRTSDIEMLKGMDHETGFLRMMFQRRHVFEHEGGVATRRYLNESGDESITEGTLIRETRENAHRLASCAVRMATNFEAGFHEIFPVVEDQEAK